MEVMVSPSVVRASVVRAWVANLPFKQQTVVLCALRGCDGLPKEDPSKPFVRYYRHCVLLNAATPGGPNDDGFMALGAAPDLRTFPDLDRYPMHWVGHFMHGAEILAYNHDDPLVAAYWAAVYLKIVHALHLQPETLADLNRRLAVCENG
jgi:hypothetical protein